MKTLIIFLTIMSINSFGQDSKGAIYFRGSTYPNINYSNLEKILNHNDIGPCDMSYISSIPYYMMLGRRSKETHVCYSTVDGMDVTVYTYEAWNNKKGSGIKLIKSEEYDSFGLFKKHLYVIPGQSNSR